jgi:hypothetical protein
MLLYGELYGGIVMMRFPCPYLRVEVELTEERERHIADGSEIDFQVRPRSGHSLYQ